MPELPEVETVLRQIKPHILDRAIAKVTITPKGENMIKPHSKSEFITKIEGRIFTSADRIGKFMIFNLDSKDKIIGHLRMSGRMLITDMPMTNEHNRIYLALDNSKILNFVDIRRFGTFHFVEAGKSYKGLTKLGPDALTDAFNADYLFQRLSKRSKNIYSALLDQSIVAGLGNIYVNEVLFATGIHPNTPANKITKTQAIDLVSHSKRILNMAVDFRGTTLIDKTYTDSEGMYGDFYNKLFVYGKAGEACANCGKTLEKIKLGSRSVHFCPSCQK